MSEYNIFSFKLLWLYVWPRIYIKPHISPTDTILTDLFPSIEGQSSAHLTKPSFELPLYQYFLAITLVGFSF